jgi:hypothetical protein
MALSMVLLSSSSSKMDVGNMLLLILESHTIHKQRLLFMDIVQIQMSSGFH